MLESGVRIGAVSACRGAYWFIRLARSAIGFGLKPAALPGQLTPDGAARHALASLPLRPDQAIALSRRKDAEMAAGIDRLPAPEDLAFAETRMVLESLGWIYNAIVDEDLAVQVSNWLEVYREMAPIRG